MVWVICSSITSILYSIVGNNCLPLYYHELIFWYIQLLHFSLRSSTLFWFPWLQFSWGYFCCCSSCYQGNINKIPRFRLGWEFDNILSPRSFLHNKILQRSFRYSNQIIRQTHVIIFYFKLITPRFIHLSQHPTIYLLF